MCRWRLITYRCTCRDQSATERALSPTRGLLRLRYRVGVAIDDDVIGDDPLVNGMQLSMRLRRDFTVTDADRLLTTARRAYRELKPGTSAAEAGAHIGSADGVEPLGCPVLPSRAALCSDRMAVTRTAASGAGWFKVPIRTFRERS